MQTLSNRNYQDLCNHLACSDPDLAVIINQYGYPPLWSRPNNYETLVHIILEQQVSLASAKASLERLREFTGIIEPKTVVNLSDMELKSCFVSRQKARYIKLLAQEIIDGSLDLGALEQQQDDQVRLRLIKLIGVGNWTIDIYLMMVLHRLDIFPAGDLAAVSALRHIKSLSKNESIEAIVQAWQPYKSIATMLLWHYYLSQKTKLKLLTNKVD